MSGSVSVVINPLPVVYAITGGGSYCAGGAGVHIGLGGSEFGLSYQLYNSGVPSGSAVSGTGAAIDFGLRTATGSYTIVAANPATACVNNMSGSASVSVNPLPTVYAVTGGGSYCVGGSGVSVGLGGSNTGVNYQLYYNGSAAGTAVAGTGSAISFGPQMSAGTYSVVAIDGTTGCGNNMSGTVTVTINPLPTVYTVTGGGAYCAGGVGMHVGLSNSAVGISYQLYDGSGAVGGLVPGTGSALDFGLQTAAGSYSVTAGNVPTGCMSNMSGSVAITVDPLPTVFSVTGGGSYCAGSTGSDIQLNGSQVGVNYQLYNGSATVGSPMAGTNGVIDFGPQVGAGTYSVSAVNVTTTCRSDMGGSATVTINPLPVVYTVTGGGSYCTGGAGVHVGLSGSNTGINYRLYNTGILVNTMAGTGAAIDFGLETAAGTYTVVAIDGGPGGCSRSMNSSAVITVNALPPAHNVTGGGGYCSGGIGVVIGLDGSEGGVTYQLYNGSSATGGPVTGSGAAITFGLQLAAGTYSVSALNTTTGCSSNMNGNAVININPLPTVYTVLGGGSYCAGGGGVDVSLSGSQAGITYALKQGGTVVAILGGTGVGTLDFGLQPAGVYTIAGVSGVSCNSTMSGSAVVTMNPLPVVYNVTGGGGYCAGGTGVHIGLSGSEAGISYQLYNGTPSGGAMSAGGGAAIDFGLRVAVGAYSVIATNSTTGCIQTMSLTATVTINALPVVYNVTGGGGYCAGGAGVDVGLDNSEAGTTYQLLNGAIPVISITSVGGGALDFGNQVAGSYTVRATNGSLCISMMNGIATVTMNPLPAAFTVTGGGHYCGGGPGMHVGLSGSATGISYQLYNTAGAVGGPVAGTGAALDFGLQLTAGSYSVTATNNTTTCTNNMTGGVTVTIDPLPVAYNINGGGSYCAGGTGVDVSISWSDAGISYRLYNGSLPVSPAQAGTGTGGIDFGNQLAAGTYVVVATNTVTPTHCVNTMTGSVTVSINPLPVAYTVVSSASNYCAGGIGVDLSLSGSETGVSYQLYVNSAPVGVPMAGTGSALDFGLQLAPGAYTVIAANTATGCTNNMLNSVPIAVNPLPAVFTLTGGGSYCVGGTGVHIGLSGSQPGIRYDLYNGSIPGGSLMGTGGALDFGLQTAAGTYIVVATNVVTTCVQILPGTAIVTVNALPAGYAVLGGGNYCSGGTGADVTLAGSQSGVSYQLYNGGLPTGSAMAGTGAALDFGLSTGAGAYTVMATNTTTGCINSMTGSATIGVYAAPVVYTVTGGGSYCNGGTGVHIGLSGSEAGMQYQLNNGSPVGSYVTGTGGALDFGLQTAAGAYTVVANNLSTGCSGNMSGSVVVTVNALPGVYTVTGGGSYCSGTGGVHVGLSGSANGIKYQLYLGASTVGGPVNGTGSSLDFGLQLAPGVYTVSAANSTTGCGDNMTGSVTVIVNPTVVPSVTIVSTPGDTVCAGTNVSYVAMTANGGSLPMYDWNVNGLSVSNLNNYNYVPTNGDVVTVTMTSNELCAVPATVSSNVTMTVNANVMPVVSITADLGDTVCSGTVVNFTANPTYGGTPGYTWRVNGVSVGSGATYTYVPVAGDVIMCMMSSTYTCRLANTVFSAPITMTVDTPLSPLVAILANPGTRIAQGQSDTLTAIVPGGVSGYVTLSYQWLVNGNPVPGATYPTFISSGFNNRDSVTVEVTASSSCGDLSTFNSVIIYIQGVGVTTVKGVAGNIQLMPNPNKGAFTVKGTLGNTADEEVTMEITDVLGQVVYKNKVMSRNGVIDEQIQLGSTVANGMYVLSLHTATENKVFHVVIEQ